MCLCGVLAFLVGMQFTCEDASNEEAVLGLVQTLIELKALLEAVVIAKSVEAGATHCRMAVERIDEVLQTTRDEYLSARNIKIDL